MTTKNFFLKSMGCKSNQFEGALIIEKLIEAGFNQVFDIKSADYYILNSCSVTHKSDNEALYLLRNAFNINPNMATASYFDEKNHSDIKSVFLDKSIGGFSIEISNRI